MNNEIELKLAKELVKIIEKWVGENFGSQEVEDPSWSIEDLATEIAQNGYSLFKIMQREYVKEGICDVAERNGEEPYSLSDRELDRATDIYMDGDVYGQLTDEQIDSMLDAVKEVIEEKVENVLDKS